MSLFAMFCNDWGSITCENTKYVQKKTAASLHIAINLLSTFGGVLLDDVITNYKTKENLFPRGEVASC
jgi:hypothetical protein